MSAFDVLARYGTLALVRFVATVAAFLALHLARVPLLLTVELIETAMYRLDRYLSTRATPYPPGPAPQQPPRHPREAVWQPVGEYGR